MLRRSAAILKRTRNAPRGDNALRLVHVANLNPMLSSDCSQIGTGSSNSPRSAIESFSAYESPENNRNRCHWSRFRRVGGSGERQFRIQTLFFLASVERVPYGIVTGCRCGAHILYCWPGIQLMSLLCRTKISIAREPARWLVRWGLISEPRSQWHWPTLAIGSDFSASWRLRRR